MDKPAIVALCNAAIMDVLSVDVSGMSPTGAVGEQFSIDSLGMIELCMAIEATLEDENGVVIKIEDDRMAEIKSLRGLYDVVEELVQAAA